MPPLRPSPPLHPRLLCPKSFCHLDFHFQFRKWKFNFKSLYKFKKTWKKKQNTWIIQYLIGKKSRLYRGLSWVLELALLLLLRTWDILLLRGKMRCSQWQVITAEWQTERGLRSASCTEKKICKSVCTEKKCKYERLREWSSEPYWLKTWVLRWERWAEASQSVQKRNANLRESESNRQSLTEWWL